MKPKTFETQRLFLRPTNEEDAELTFQIFNTEKFKEMIGDRNVNSPEEALVYLKEKVLPQIEKLGYGNYTVIRKSDHKKIGNCGIYRREGLDVADIGFSYLPEFYSQGYGYEAAKVLRDAAFEVFGLNEISAITIKENIPSQKLIEKLGLQFNKIINLPNDPEDLWYYTLKKSDWEVL